MTRLTAEASATRMLNNVYGDTFITPDAWGQLRRQHPGTTFEEQIQIAMTEYVTCENTGFVREPNTRLLPRWMAQEGERHWSILSVGAANGAEPYEFAMRLMASGQTDFSLAAIDVIPGLVEEARGGKYSFSNYSSYKEEEFFRAMGRAKLVRRSGSKGDLTYSVKQRVKSHIAFAQHDIIDSAFFPPGQAPYDIVLCQNVLLHYPEATRGLMLLHMVESMQDGGILSLEKYRFFDHNEKKIQPAFAAHVMAYEEWREDLSELGLIAEWLPQEGTPFSYKVFRYDPSKNKFLGKRMVLRDRRLVELTQ